MKIVFISKEYSIINIYDDNFATDFSKTLNEETIEINKTIYESRDDELYFSN